MTLNYAKCIDVQTIFIHLKVGFFTQLCIGVLNVQVFRGDRQQPRSGNSVKKFVDSYTRKIGFLALKKLKGNVRIKGVNFAY